MGILENHFNETVVIKRMATTSGAKKALSTVIASYACYIQPLGDRNVGDIEGGFGKDLRMFGANADIREGDRVVRGSDEYKVVGVVHHDFEGHSHTEATIRIFED